MEVVFPLGDAEISSILHDQYHKFPWFFYTYNFSTVSVADVIRDKISNLLNNVDSLLVRSEPLSKLLPSFADIFSLFVTVAFLSSFRSYFLILRIPWSRGYELRLSNLIIDDITFVIAFGWLDIRRRSAIEVNRLSSCSGRYHRISEK